MITQTDIVRVRADRDGGRLGARETGWGERKRGRQRAIGRHTETDRQVGRETDIQTRKTDGRTDRQRQKQRQKQRHETRDIQEADTNSH